MRSKLDSPQTCRRVTIEHTNGKREAGRTTALVFNSATTDTASVNKTIHNRAETSQLTGLYPLPQRAVPATIRNGAR
jgi:hypothetical protein